MSDSLLITETLSLSDGRQLARATLNAPKSLNALNLDMIRQLDAALDAWSRDDSIVAVIIQGSGQKAFCAGGDVVQLYHSSRALNEGRVDAYAQTFFTAEYTLDHRIHTYPKPVIALGRGVVMGGGLGVLAGASHRVVTETTRMAMPEITIGLYPDVGGSWFLNRMPGRVGLFLGLTGARLNAADAEFVGLADFIIPDETVDGLAERLCAATWDRPVHAVINQALRELRDEKRVIPSPVREHYDLIQALTDADSIVECVQRITAHESDDRWIASGIRNLSHGCPVTPYLVLEQLRRGRHLSLADVFRLELVMSVQCARHPDFAEGVRALLIDKDNQPAWQHSGVEAVPAEYVAAHFEAPWGDAPHPLAQL